MLISERRMQNDKLAARDNENHLRVSQVVLGTGALPVAHAIHILSSDFISSRFVRFRHR